MPFVVVESRSVHATNATKAAGSAATVAYSDMRFWQVGISLYQKRGMSVFFNGIGTAVFYIYEKLKETEMLRL